MPAVHYRFFVELLLATIREEIGACMEKAYERMTAAEVVRMLGLSSKADLPAFVSKVSDGGRVGRSSWSVVGSMVLGRGLEGNGRKLKVFDLVRFS